MSDPKPTSKMCESEHHYTYTTITDNKQQVVSDDHFIKELLSTISMTPQDEELLMLICNAVCVYYHEYNLKQIPFPEIKHLVEACTVIFEKLNGGTVETRKPLDYHRQKMFVDASWLWDDISEPVKDAILAMC